ncbi:hypothetical protein HAX54_010204 [Datura stramonium]|uniref:Uncharacterized protein n=1 Tax=Datura stramonium TaxID=4076 RepID=A0ABS8TFY2_DATST|nr:hypothetical protein [Datura stramonium]
MMEKVAGLWGFEAVWGWWLFWLVWWPETKRNGRGMVSGRGLVHRSSGSFLAGVWVLRVVTDTVKEGEEEGSEEGERATGMRWSTENNGGFFSGGFWPEVEGEEERGEATLR